MNEELLVYASGLLVVVLSKLSEASLICHHQFKVSCVAISPSGSWIASGDVNGCVCSFTLLHSTVGFIGESLGLRRRLCVEV